MGVVEQVEVIEQQLRAIRDPERAVQERRYLKSDLEFIGVNIPTLRARVRPMARAITDRGALWALVDALWAREVHELRMLALLLLQARVSLLEPADLPALEAMLRACRTWALVDTLAPHVVGPLVVRHPTVAATLDRWAVDPDFWVRRAALLSLLVPLRQGGGDVDRFFRYADSMLEEKEFFIRKAIGWVLRDVSRTRPELVVSWLTPRLTRCSGVTFREAVRHLPPPAQAQLQAAYRVA